MYTFARFLQALGLVFVPVALYVGIQGHASDQPGIAARELAILGAGALLFVIGRALEGRAR